jgi:hypothetical protein
MSSWITPKRIVKKIVPPTTTTTGKIESSINDNDFITNDIEVLKVENKQEYKSVLDYIDAIFYINLEHRTDRNSHILAEIKKIDPTLKKTHRFDAIYIPSNGALGATLSHTGILKKCLEHPEWNHIAIFEDDFTFVSNNSELISNNLLNIINSVDNADMILLAYGIVDFKKQKTSNSNILKVFSVQTASGYIINKNYIQILLDNFIFSGEQLKLFGKKHEYCLDQYWKRLMPSGKWYTTRERLGYQYANWSDIENQFNDYKC